MKWPKWRVSGWRCRRLLRSEVLTLMTISWRRKSIQMAYQLNISYCAFWRGERKTFTLRNDKQTTMMKKRDATSLRAGVHFRPVWTGGYQYKLPLLDSIKNTTSNGWCTYHPKMNLSTALTIRCAIIGEITDAASDKEWWLSLATYSAFNGVSALDSESWLNIVQMIFW